MISYDISKRVAIHHYIYVMITNIVKNCLYDEYLQKRTSVNNLWHFYYVSKSSKLIESRYFYNDLLYLEVQ